MPELPEVQTTVNGLSQKVLNRTFIGLWTDWKKMVKQPKDFALLEKEIRGKKILRVWRRAKNVIFELSDNYSLLVHMKMTGHLMVGRWIEDGAGWKPVERGPFDEKINLYIHFLWFLDDGRMIALSDLRKFGKVELWKTDDLMKSDDYVGWGPEPLAADFTVEQFKQIFHKKKGKVKQVIMVPQVIAGVGNIYASEALWWSKIHPEKDVSQLSDKELKDLYQAIRKVLKTGIDLGGESFDDYRNVDGERGTFYKERKAYGREGQPCFRCKTLLVRKKHGGRSSFFCPQCQQL